MNKRLQILPLIIAISGWIHLTWLAAEQPVTIPNSDAQTKSQQDQSEVSQNQSTPAANSVEAVKDPLLRMIRDQLNDNRPSLIPDDNPNVSQSPIDSEAPLSAGEWEAVELILRAARILEREAKSHAANDRVATHQSNVKQLRNDALRILRRSIEPR